MRGHPRVRRLGQIDWGSIISAGISAGGGIAASALAPKPAVASVPTAVAQAPASTLPSVSSLPSYAWILIALAGAALLVTVLKR